MFYADFYNLHPILSCGPLIIRAVLFSWNCEWTMNDKLLLSGLDNNDRVFSLSLTMSGRIHEFDMNNIPDRQTPRRPLYTPRMVLSILFFLFWGILCLVGWALALSNMKRSTC